MSGYGTRNQLIKDSAERATNFTYEAYLLGIDLTDDQKEKAIQVAANANNIAWGAVKRYVEIEREIARLESELKEL